MDNNNFEMNTQDTPVVDNTPVEGAPVVENTTVEATPVVEAPTFESTPVYESAPTFESAPVYESAPSQAGAAEMSYEYVPSADGAQIVGEDTSKDGMCMAAFILGIVGFIFNPFYIISILAIVFGAIGQGSASKNADKAKIGLFLGIGAIALQIIGDIVLTLVTGGAGVVFCCC